MPRRVIPPNVADDLAIRFSYHAPKPDQLSDFGDLREAAHHFALLVASRVPPGREQSLAFTKIEEAVMFANAGIARQPAKERRAQVAMVPGGITHARDSYPAADRTDTTQATAYRPGQG